MAGTTFFGLVGANPAASVLDNLKNASGNLKSTLNDALNSALKSQLSDLLNKASLPVIAGLVAQMPVADILVASSQTIQAFAKQQLDPMVAKDPAMQQAVDAELAKLSDTMAIGGVLQLNTSLASHPIFKADVMKADIASLLATSPQLGQNQQLQADFINRYSALTGTIQDFWKQLSNDAEFKAAVPELQFTLQLGTLTLNNSPLVAAIRKQYNPKSVRDLTAQSASDWAQLITSNNISIPASMSGVNAEEKTTNYVNTILSALRSAFPTDYIAQTLAANPHDPLDQQVATFLRASPQFNLITTNLQRFVAQNPSALTGVADQATFVQRLSGYQRLTRLNSDPQVVTALASRGLDSAYKISSLPRAGFLSQYSQLLGGSDKAQAVYASAQRITASATNFFMTVREGLSNSHPWVFGNVSKEVSAAVQQIPNWQELFGPTSTCACQDCRSVVSPAAYFVDLLHFLSKAHIDPNDPNSNTLLGILAGRRPDLVNLKLNCENTNTTLPYLDLVNEVLESVVMTHIGDPPRPPVHDTPPDATPDQLRVNPGFTNDAAYLLLADAFYPFSLPFDRFLTIARTYLEFAGSSLYEIMKTFQIGGDPAVPANSNPNPAPGDLAIALEYLKISSNEFLILTGQPFQGTSPVPANPRELISYPGLSKYYGYNPPQPPTDWVADLASVPNFLQRTGVTYGDLVSLLETHFLNPDQAISLQSNDPQNVCNVQSMVITNLVRMRKDNPDYSPLQKMYRFIRLFLKLSWRISDLDSALTALGAGDIDVAFLLKLSQIKKLQDQLSLSVAEALALWADINTWGATSLYMSLFQNKGAVNPLDPSSALRYTYTLAAAPASGLSFLDAYAARISYSAGQLQFTGPLGTDTPPQPQPMTFNQERFLLSLSTDANYQYAVNQLFLQSQSYPQNPVSLASLPAGFSLPTQLPDAIYYQGNQLFIISQMSDAFRTQLKGLSTDSNYQLAIDNLYAMRWAPGTEVAVATQALGSQAGQLIPVQTIPAHANTLLAALRISAVDLAAIVAYLWNQSAQTTPGLTPSNTGGSLASGTYYVKVSVIDASGERLCANETSVVVIPLHDSIAVSWGPVSGAISYNVYYTAPNSGAGSESLRISPVPPTATSLTITTTTTGGSVFAATAFPLNLSNLSAVFRYARLARALSISAADLLSLIQLIGMNPFQPSVPGTPPTPGTIEFVAKAQEILRSKFSVAQLNYIYRNVAARSAGLAPQQSDLDQFVSSLQTALTAPATEKSPTSDPTGQLLQQYLKAVLEPADVSELMQIINGTVQFSASLQALPPITFPRSLQTSISFSGGTLTFTGPMSAAQKNQLLALSTDPSYQNAIRNLFQQSQPAWTRLYTSALSPAPLPAVSFPTAFKGTGSNAVPFSVGPMPVISSVSPPASQTLPVPVTITGANFGALQGTVTLNGSSLPVTSWTDTQIGVTVPAGAGSGSIVVTVGGNASNAVPFSVGTAPAISSVTPFAGQALTPVTIAGVNFDTTGTLTLNGSPVTPTSWSPTQIQFAVPNGASSGNLVVTVGGNSSNPVPFSVGSMPAISSVSPPAVHAAPSVTIAGANFGSSQGTSTVTLNGSTLIVNSWSDTQIVVTVLTGGAGGNLIVTVGGNASNAMPLSIGTAPMISSVSPPAAPLSTSVTINGVNFGTQQGTVTVNGVAVTQVNNWSDSQISIIVPAGAANGNIVVTVAGNASNAVQFIVGTTPVISSLTPPAGQVLPIVVTIAGANFGSSQGSSTVTLNGAPLTVNRWSNTQITVTIPAVAATGSIVVTVGGNASNAVQFSVASKPVISSVSPPEVQVPPPVTITGVNFGAQQGTSAVTLNGFAVAVTSWTDTQIGITLPAGATTGNIVVSVGALIAIDSTNSFITFLGPMSADQENQLLALSTDPNYQAAIQDVFQQSKSVWTTPHTFALAALPIIALPSLNSGVVAFDSSNPANPVMKFTGSLSDADEATLLGLSSDPAYQQAVESLYFQARQFLLTKLFFLDAGSLIQNLINDPTASIADKCGFVLNSLLSSIGLIVRGVSSALNLDVNLVRLLLVGGQSASSPALLKAFVDPNLAAIADFFALLGNGLSATYFPNPNFGGSSQMSNDPAIDLNWGPTSPPLPRLDPNAFSAKWTGQLLPGFSETYTFDVRVVPPAGTVTTKARAVTWVSGAMFNAAWNGATIYINGVAYTIQSVTDGLNLMLTNSAGVQTSAVPYYVPPVAGPTVISLAINGNPLPLTELQPNRSNPPPPNAGPPPIDFTATALLSAGVLTSIELDYPNAAGSMLSGLQLSWSSLSTPKSVIAQHHLYSDPTFSFDKPLGTFKLLSRIALLVNTFRITFADLTYLSANPTAFEGVDPNNPNDSTKAAPFNLGALPSGPSSYIPALFNQWERLLALFTLRDALPTGDSGLLALFQAAGSTPALNSAALISAIATATSWDPSELGVLLGSQSDPLISASIGFSLAAGDFVDERWLVRLRSCFALMTRFGVSSKQLFEWAALGANPYGTVTTNGTTVTWVSGANFSTAWTLATIYINGVPYGIQLVGTNTLTLATSAGVQNNPVPFYVAGFTLAFEPNVARDIQAAIKAKYDDSTWVKVGKKLNDGLREASRDALVAYILAPPAKWDLAVDSITTPDQLYEYFLIDVEMGACMQTSRIVQATAAVQLFVQRCLMNLESGISPAAIDTTVWNWMKNYRVWQANREVFLYPENWIDPTLRDDKTPFFKELETELLQNPITPDNVQQAFLNYLERLEQVARLDVRGIYWQFDPNSTARSNGTPDATNDVLHVFARTPAIPNQYFYRRLLNTSQYGQNNGTSGSQQGQKKGQAIWTPWESINVDIQGDHLVPVVWNGRLYIIWPVFTEAPDQANQSANPPKKMLQIQVAWSQYSQGKWSPKQISTSFVVPEFSPDGIKLQFSALYSAQLNTGVFYFLPEFSNSGDLIISVWTPRWSSQTSARDLLYFPGEASPGVAQLDGTVWWGEQDGAQFQGQFVFTGCAGEIKVSNTDQSGQLTAGTANSIINETFSGGTEMTYDSNVLVTTFPPPQILWSSIPSILLSNPPAAYRLTAVPSLPPFAPAFSTGGDTPFFFQDDRRSYFVTGAKPVVYGLQQHLRFAPFWHPHVCVFETTLNRYGLPTLLSLVTQRRTNDGGILSGFSLSVPSDEPHDPTAVLTAGSLYAEGQFYQTPLGSQPSVPAFSRSQYSQYSRFLFSDQEGKLYYADQTPNTPGDALVGQVVTDGGDSIVQVVPASALAPPTIFQEIYGPGGLIVQPYPEENVDFSYSGAYSVYNWELFFHIPLLIATKLSQNQQFEEALKWFHYIFNPTTNSSDLIPQRFWNFLPFYECSASDEINGSIESLLRELDPPSGTVNTVGSAVTWVSGAVFDARWAGSTINIAGIGYTIQTVGGPTTLTLGGAGAGNQTDVPYYVAITLPPEPSECGLDIGPQIAQWELDPFDPFLIARMRTIAFRKTVVMKYIDNLIAWGDYLFRQNTRESINEAIQIYVLADQILGDKPVTIPPQGTIQDYTYQDLVNQGLDDFSNALVTLETTFPFSVGTPIAGANGGGTGSLNGAAAQSFYFCIPSNDQLLGYWNTVADRLYKIRHCMNIQGQVEELALFAPPINPALLVQAAAAGIDLSSVLNEINTPVPNYRFTFMLQKALELCAEVRSLGASLLSALEKNDAEGLSLLRSTQEISLLQAVLQIKQSQVDEANDNLNALQASKDVTLYRQSYYQQLMATGLTTFEDQQTTQLSVSHAHEHNAETSDMIGSIASLIGEFSFSAGGPSWSFGGNELYHAAAAIGQYQRTLASTYTYNANMLALTGGWDRRATEWNFQLQTATKELPQIQSQIDAATVRVQIAQTDVQNQQLQITNAQAVLDFLNSKYTNQELYGWMISQISATYFQCYQMAYGLAKRAEACLRFELGLTDSNFIQFGYWDSLRKGLQAGEGLYADLKRMEIAFLDQNQRKYEITKYISLVMFDPLALITLKETGQCLVSLPEALFDMDYPGQYLRQIESVSLTMPCVTGPYTSVNCKLTLVSSKIRVDTAATSPQDYIQDAHFITNFAATQSIVTSSAQNDSGMFELNFRDERYLPFQGAGVISQWLVELPQDCNAFDFETITDLVVNLKYSARDGGDALRAVAKQAATLSGPTDQTSLSADSVSFPPQNNLVRFFSLRHEFPTEWYKFLNPLATDTAQTMLLALTRERFPFQYRGKKISINQVDLLLKFKDIYDAQQFTTGTPLGDFAAGGGAPGLLNVYVTQAPPSMGATPQAPTKPPTSVNPIQLTSNPVNFNGSPYGNSLASPVLLNLGACWLQVFTSANYIGSIAPTLMDSNKHLVPGIIEDVFLACHYSTT